MPIILLLGTKKIDFSCFYYRERICNSSDFTRAKSSKCFESFDFIFGCGGFACCLFGDAFGCRLWSITWMVIGTGAMWYVDIEWRPLLYGINTAFSSNRVRQVRQSAPLTYLFYDLKGVFFYSKMLVTVNPIKILQQ